MRKLEVETVASVDINEALSNPAAHINEDVDIVLVTIHDPKYPENPTMLLAGKDEVGYYICVEDGEVCNYHYSDADFPLPELYADLLARNTTGNTEDRLFDMYEEVSDLLEFAPDNTEVLSDEVNEVYASLQQLKQALERAGFVSEKVKLDG